MAVLRYVVIGLAIAYLLVELLDIFVGIAEMIGAEDAERAATRGRHAPRSRGSDRTKFTSSSYKEAKDTKDRTASNARDGAGPQSHGGDGAKAGTGSDKERFAASQALLLAIDQNDVPTLRTLLKTSAIDVNHENAQGGALFRLCNRIDGDEPKTLQMLELLLAHPHIEVNGNGRSWPPLKAALGRHNQEQARLLLKHPRIRPFVQVGGLGCDVLRHTPAGVVYVYDSEDPSCFKHARDALSVREYVQKHGPGAPPTTATTPESSQARTAGTGNSQQSQPKIADFGPDSPVMNPVLYPSLPVLLWAYLVGDTLPMPAVMVACLLWVAVHLTLLSIGVLSVFGPRKRHDVDEVAPARPPPQAPEPVPVPDPQ